MGGSMREWLNAILAFIGATSLTDQEYSSMNLLNVTINVYNQAAYDELAKVLAGRELVSDMQDRLVGFFKAKGLDSVAPLDVARSEIFIGAAL